MEPCLKTHTRPMRKYSSRRPKFDMTPAQRPMLQGTNGVINLELSSDFPFHCEASFVGDSTGTLELCNAMQHIHVVNIPLDTLQHATLAHGVCSLM